MKMLINAIFWIRIETALELMNSVDYLFSFFFFITGYSMDTFLVAGEYKDVFFFSEESMQSVKYLVFLFAFFRQKGA